MMKMKNPTIQELRTFSAVIMVAGVVFFLVGYFRMHPVLMMLGGSFVVAIGVSQFSSDMLNRFFRGWMLLAHWLGWINTRLLLTLFFLALLTPVALLLRFFRRRPEGFSGFVKRDSEWKDCAVVEEDHWQRMY